VHVERVDDLEPGQGAKLLLHALVALARGNLLGERVGGRVQPRGGDPHPCLAPVSCDLAPERGQPPGQLRDAGEHGRAHLDAVLKELAGHKLGTVGGGTEHGLHGRGQLPGGRVDELKLFFYARCEGGGRPEAFVHPTIIPRSIST
jgi:hypothetical protein